MCGIVGIAALGDFERDPSLEAMRDTLRHRGPDDQGIWRSDNRRVALGHTRLAVLDLSPAAHQPMVDRTGKLVIAFNGEIYNHAELRSLLETGGVRFRSRSDTEVVLEAYRAWGRDALRRLRGMFAFALYDDTNSTLLLARDRAGEKPLFYRHDSTGLWFASELKALLADPAAPRRLNLAAADSYFAYGYVSGSACILEGYRKLPPGHSLTIDLTTGRTALVRYWALPEPPSAASSCDANELVERLERLLIASVRRQLVADVPVAVLLSGGLDSSLITAAAVQSFDDLKTFTVTFPGHTSFDEAPYARLVANHFGTDHTEMPLEPMEVEFLPKLARQFDEPIADHAIIPTAVLARMVRSSATVALGGDGGDELFGGYGHYSFLHRLAQARSWIPSPVRSEIGRLATRLPVGIRGRNHLIGLSGDLANSIAHVNVYFDGYSRRALVPSLVPRAEGLRAALCDPRLSLVQQATRADFCSTMVDGYLVKVDRASMLSSLEVRCPLLDQELVEFAFGHVPDSLRATATRRKVLLQMLGSRMLPSSLDMKRKQGFTIPLSAWFKGKWGVYIEEVLMNAKPGFFDQRQLASMVRHQGGIRSNASRLFALTMFELWRREYSIQLPG